MANDDFKDNLIRKNRKPYQLGRNTFKFSVIYTWAYVPWIIVVSKCADLPFLKQWDGCSLLLSHTSLSHNGSDNGSAQQYIYASAFFPTHKKPELAILPVI